MTRDDSAGALPAVLITGCSSGIGFHSAVDLAKRGWRVFAGVRRLEDGQRLSQAHGNIEPLLLDITCEESIAKATTFLRSQRLDDGLAALVNNAGILVSGPLELISLEQLRQQFDVNILGTHAITLAMLPWLKTKGLQSKSSPVNSARLVFVGSISGRVTPPYYGAYAASKHALEAIADAWRMELKCCGVNVSIIEPDSVATPIWDKSSAGLSELATREGSANSREVAEQLRAVRRNGLANKKTGMDVAHVVAAVRASLSARRPKSHYAVGWRTRPAFFFEQLLPARWMDYVLSKMIK